MPNHSRTHADGVYVNGFAPPPSSWEDLERKIFHSWNGDLGGAYSPSGNTTIGGSGLQVTTKVRLTAGGAIRGGAGVFKIRDGTWPRLSATHVASQRKIVQTITHFHGNYTHLWCKPKGFAGVGTVALACRLTTTPKAELPELYVPLRVIDGSKLVSVDVNFRVASKRIYAPIAMPKIRILRYPRDIGSEDVVALRAENDGFWSPELVTTPDGWYQDGEAQVMTYVCDQNHTIDVENYSYVLHLVEELGIQTPDDPFDGIRYVERKADCYAAQAHTLQDFTDTDSPAIETGAAQQGMPMLMVDPDEAIDRDESISTSYKNGIWLQMTGAWPRRPDLISASDFTPHWIVRVTYGTINGQSTWQCQYPSQNNRIVLTGSVGTSLTNIQITPARAYGNIYHSLVPTFEVADLRFQ